MPLVAPSLLAADFGRLAEEVETVEQGGADYLHLDVMDGHFVPNLTFGPQVVAHLRKHSSLLFDVHLMIEKPEASIRAFAAAGADIISVHVEACSHLHRVLQSIREQGCKSAAALNPATPLETVRWVLEDLDMVLIMSVNPGFGGQAFIGQTVEKIEQLRMMLKAEKCDHVAIEVDGGINLDTAREVSAAGADVLVAGSAVFEARDRRVMIQKLKQV